MMIIIINQESDLKNDTHKLHRVPSIQTDPLNLFRRLSVTDNKKSSDFPSRLEL